VEDAERQGITTGLHVLQLVDGKATVTNPTACIGHGECLRACPVDAIELVLGSERRGVEIPLVAKDFQTSVPGLYVVGELGAAHLFEHDLVVEMERAPPRGKGVGRDGEHFSLRQDGMLKALSFQVGEYGHQVLR